MHSRLAEASQKVRRRAPGPRVAARGRWELPRGQVQARGPVAGFAAVALGFLLFALVPSSLGAAPVIDGSFAPVKGNANLLKVTFTDHRSTGSQRFFSVVVTINGVNITSGQGPIGKNCSSDGVRFGCVDPVGPGETVTYTVNTDKPLPTGATGLIEAFFEGNPTPVTGPLSGPSTPPPPTTTQVTPPPGSTAVPCRCLNIRTRTSGAADFTANTAAITAFSFRVTWTMQCAGAPGNCKGEIAVVKPGGTDITLTAPTAMEKVSCEGRCRPGQGIEVWRGTFRVAGTSTTSLDKDRRAGKSFEFEFKKYCLRGGKPVSAGRGFMTIAYGPHGLVNRKESDLNGDGKPDGAQK